VNKTSRIFVAGHQGLVGSALLRKLREKNYQSILTVSKEQLDLTSEHCVNNFFSRELPEYVFLAAAKVGGIEANNEFPTDFLLENLRIQNNVIPAAVKYQVRKLIFLGSSCIYPKSCPQPIRESYLLSGPLESTNEPYAIAKIAGLKLCESYNRQHGTNFISLLPCNLYGPGDSYDLRQSHVIPALIKKCVLGRLLAEDRLSEAMKLAGCSEKDSFKRFINEHQISSRQITVWGTGKPRREFLHVDDLAACCVMIMEKFDFINRPIDGNFHHINVGYGSDIEIRELVQLIKKMTGFMGKIAFDPSRPDGTYQKLLDSNVINNLGWKPNITLIEGLQRTINEEFHKYN
jgi:GDP-L-fucose synthase